MISLLIVWASGAHAQGSGQAAVKDLSITDGATCNEPTAPGTIKYLRNTNKSKSVVAALRVVRSPSEGKPETTRVTYTVAPMSDVELGCDREGGGAPIVVDVSWEIQSAKYK